MDKKTSTDTTPLYCIQKVIIAVTKLTLPLSNILKTTQAFIGGMVCINGGVIITITLLVITLFNSFEETNARTYPVC